MTSKKKVLKILRQSAFLTVNLVLRQLVWTLLALTRPFHLFQYLFLVYPGSASDLDGYCPRKLAESGLFRRKPTLGGYVSRGPGGRGLLLVVPDTVADFTTSDAARKEVSKRLLGISRMSGAKAIALAGQLPGIFVRKGNRLARPFVTGDKGAVFCVMETLSQIIMKHGLDPSRLKIAIVGVGYVGGLLFNAFQDEGYNVAGIDIVITRHGVALRQDSEVMLRTADIVIVLTPKGSDFLPYIPHLKNGAIIIDDTHPKIKWEEQPEGMLFYKAAVGIGNSRFYPALPGFQANWIPGCAVEAIVAAATGDFCFKSQREFSRLAREIGFFAHMVK